MDLKKNIIWMKCIKYSFWKKSRKMWKQKLCPDNWLFAINIHGNDFRKCMFLGPSESKKISGFHFIKLTFFESWGHSKVEIIFCCFVNTLLLIFRKILLASLVSVLWWTLFSWFYFSPRTPFYLLISHIMQSLLLYFPPVFKVTISYPGYVKILLM